MHTKNASLHHFRFSNAASVWVRQLILPDYFVGLCLKFLLFGIYNNIGYTTNQYRNSKTKILWYLFYFKIIEL